MVVACVRTEFGAWYSPLVLLVIISVWFTMEHTFVRRTQSSLLFIARIGVHRRGEDRSCPIASSDCSVSFSIAQSMMHFDQWIGLQLWTRLTISSSGQTLFYCSALFYLTVNRYTVTVQKRQFLVSRPSWSPSHHRMQPISYRRIFCLGQS